MRENIKTHIKNSWDNFISFADNINKNNEDVWFSGTGMFFFDEDGVRHMYYMFRLNGDIYCSHKVGESKDGYRFKGVVQMDDGFLDSSFFRGLRAATNLNRFNKFEAEIRVECKGYEYFEEDKLLISNAGKVDLLYSQILKKNDDGFGDVKVTEHPSLKEVIRWKVVLDKVDRKIEKLG